MEKVTFCESTFITYLLCNFFFFLEYGEVMIPPRKDTNVGAVSYQAVTSSVESIKPTRSSYKKYSPKDRYKIGKYANDTGSTAAVRKFKDKFPKLNESTVREFRKKYQDQLKSAEKNGNAPDKELIPLRRGRPLLLGSDIDEKVRKFIMALRYRGG